MKLTVYEKRDAIIYLAPMIIEECREMAANLMLKRGQTELLVDVDYNTTTFSYITNGIDPRPLINVMVDDSYRRPMIIVGVPFISDEIFFKFTFEQMNAVDWKFVANYCTDRYGHFVVSDKDIKVPVFKDRNISGLIDLKNRLWKIINGTSRHYMVIQMRSKVDVVTEKPAEEETQNETYPASGDVS